jgi:hypothetical protein
MTDVSSISDLVNLWPNRKALADDCNGIAGTQLVTVHQVHKWAETGSIRALYQYLVILAAASRGFPVTAELMVRLHGEHLVREVNEAAPGVDAA